MSEQQPPSGTPEYLDSWDGAPLPPEALPEAAAAVFKPEVASLNMGSINFGLFHLLDRYKEFKFDWEPEFLAATKDLVFRNSFQDIEYILATCYENGTRFLQITPEGKIREQGYFVPLGGATSAPMVDMLPTTQTSVGDTAVRSVTPSERMSSSSR